MSELSQYIKDNCPFLLKLTQMSEAQEKEVIEKFGINNCKSQLDKMNNWKNIQNNRNVFQTLKKWFELDIQKGFFKPEINPVKNVPTRNKDVELFLHKHPIGSKLLLYGKTFTVEKNFVVNENKGYIPIYEFLNKYKGAL